MKVYISGQITGLDIEEVKERFARAELLLKSIGLTPINPLKNGLPIDEPWKAHLSRDIENLLDCNAIMMLDNWPKSTGARIEKNIAEEIGLIIFYESAVEETCLVDRVKKAIELVTGQTFEQYATKRKFRDVFFSRLIFTNQCAKGDKVSNDDIAALLLKTNQDIRRYRNIYENEYSVNKNFRELAEKVDKIIKRKYD